MTVDDQFSESPELISQLSPEEQKIADVIEDLLRPCDRKTYGEKLKQASTKLNKSVRTIQRYVKRWEDNGLVGIVQNNRADKGSYRIDSRLQDFILKTYREGNKDSKRMTPKQVYLRAVAQAKNWGMKSPSHMTVYRILNPIIAEKENKKRIRRSGWRGSQLVVSTRSGTKIDVQYSNHVWQCDHTRADILLGRFRRENELTPSGLGKITGLYGAIARWEKFRFNPSPSPEQLQKLSAIVQVEVATLETMFPSAPMKMTPIRLCSACYGGQPYHRMEWQYKSVYKCDQGEALPLRDRHQLKLLSECPNCGARFKFPALWVDGWCHRCFTPFAEMTQN